MKCLQKGVAICIDCGRDTHEMGEYYMVEDSVWLTVMGYAKGCLCVGCFEARLGRELTSSDFMQAPINHMSPRSPRLAARMEGFIFDPVASEREFTALIRNSPTFDAQLRRFRAFIKEITA